MAAGSFHTGTLKKTITVNATQQSAWRRISDITGLSAWAVGIKNTACFTKKKRGIGAIRLITFDDKSRVEEHVVAWEPGKQFTYVATNGLPLRAYVATISLKPKNDKSVQITWQSYLNSKRMTSRQFSELLVQMGTFYMASLENLKKLLEGRRNVIG